MTLKVMALELAAHWRTYYKALNSNEPVAFSWVAFGYRIIGAATWLRDQMGCEAGDPCYDLIAASGVMYYAGVRGKRRALMGRTCKRDFVPAESIPEAWDLNPFVSRPKRRKTKWFKKPRAIAEGNAVLVLHKGRRVLFKVCVTEEGAEMLTARINGKPLPMSELEVTG